MSKRQVSAYVQTKNGRKTWGQRARERIDSTVIIKKLCDVVEGKDEMSMIQLQASKLLLSKTMPDLKSVEVKQDDNADAKTITNQQLIDVIEGESKRIGNG